MDTGPQPPFHVYSQLGEHDGRSIALALERLRTFFLTSGALGVHAALENDRPVRVLQFATTSAYASFRPRASADAFFLGSEAVNYIALAPAGPNRPHTLAHEYAHLVLHSAGIHLPPWFAEGIAEVFSSLDITPRESLIGGDLRPALKYSGATPHPARRAAYDGRGRSSSIPP
jgi:hypothetical protein